LQFFGVGNEPFWSVELRADDSLSFFLADRGQPIRVKMEKISSGADSLVLTGSDSLSVLILPQMCSDGMSDHVYPHAVQVRYKNETYRGCGMRFR
jgi:uncharacterized membrane protein